VGRFDDACGDTARHFLERNSGLDIAQETQKQKVAAENE